LTAASAVEAGHRAAGVFGSPAETPARCCNPAHAPVPRQVHTAAVLLQRKQATTARIEEQRMSKGMNQKKDQKKKPAKTMKEKKDEKKGKKAAKSFAPQ
jgi:hypothetical protein